MTTDDRATILWQRLDLPGHETATLGRDGQGWRLSGVAVLAHTNRPCRVEYEIACDGHWTTRRCTLNGFVGPSSIALDVARNVSGEWTVDGAAADRLKGCDDIDLGFSPATNLLPIRRLGLAVGAKAAVRAAWVKFPELTLEVLEQTYTRLAEDRYLYESANGAFHRELLVDEVGFVLEYPDFWRAETRA
jgi:uncharacterized protein